MTRAGAADAGGTPPTLHDVLGLPPGAAPSEVETTRRRLQEYLDAAPEDLRVWAAQQAALLDTQLPDEPDLTAEDGDEPPGPPRPPRPGWYRRLVAVVGILAVAGVVYGVYHLGADEPPIQDAASWNPPAAGSAMPQVDTARLAELEAELAANPGDVEILTEIADLHIIAGEYLGAAQWQREVVAADPEDTDARLVLGVALFNAGDLDGAEEAWTTVIELDPTQAEAYYDLGFLHLARQDFTAAEEAWTTVIELTPDSELARVVATHLDGLGAMGEGG